MTNVEKLIEKMEQMDVEEFNVGGLDPFGPTGIIEFRHAYGNISFGRPRNMLSPYRLVKI